MISNKDQSSRSYNYRDNPLISQKENFFQNSNYSSPGGGLTSYYKDKGGVSMTTLPTQTSNKQRFLELEAELDLLERKNKAYKTMENFENSDVISVFPLHSFITLSRRIITNFSLQTITILKLKKDKKILSILLAKPNISITKLFKVPLDHHMKRFQLIDFLLKTPVTPLEN